MNWKTVIMKTAILPKLIYGLCNPYKNTATFFFFFAGNDKQFVWICKGLRLVKTVLKVNMIL